MLRWNTVPANAFFCILVGRAALPLKTEATTVDAEVYVAQEEAACPNYLLGAARPETEILISAEHKKSAALHLPTSFSLLQRSQNRMPALPSQAEAGAAVAAPAALDNHRSESSADSKAATAQAVDKVSAAVVAVEAAAQATEAAQALSAAAVRRPDLSAAELQQVSAAVEDAARAHEVASHQASLAAQAEVDLVGAGTKLSQLNGHLQDRTSAKDAVSNSVHAKAAAAQLRLHEAAKMKAEAAVAAAQAAAAQADAQEAATVAQIVKTQQTCHWRMPEECAPSFSYEGQQYVQCISVGSESPWCSKSDVFAGGWSSCNYICEGAGSEREPSDVSGVPVDAISTSAAALVPPFVDMKAPVLQATAPAASPSLLAGAGETPDDYLVPVYIPHSVLNSMQQHQDVAVGFDVVSPGNTSASSLTQVAKSDSSESLRRGQSSVEHGPNRKKSVGELAKLDEAGYMRVVSERSDHQMAAFVKRMIKSLGCRVKHKSGLSGFVPWYSGDRDIQDYHRLEKELRCICSLQQFWLEPINKAPLVAAAGDCQGTRWPDMVDHDAE